MLNTMVRFVLLVLLAISMTTVVAQSNDYDEISSSFQRVSPEDALKLRAILAEPVPVGALKLTLQSHFEAKRVAADRLGDVSLQVQLFRQWVYSLPEEPNPKAVLASMLSAAGQYAEAIQSSMGATLRRCTLTC